MEYQLLTIYMCKSFVGKSNDVNDVDTVISPKLQLSQNGTHSRGKENLL